MRILKSILSFALRVCISLVLIYFLFRQVDTKSLYGILKSTDIYLLGLAFLVFSGMFILCFARWWMLLKTVAMQIPLARAIVSFSGGIFFNLFLPSTIGGDFIRSVDLSVYTKKPGEVLATVFLDRLSGYVGLVIVVLVSIFFGHKLIQDNFIFVSIGIISSVLIIILVVIFNQYIYSHLNRFLSRPGPGKLKDVIRILHEEVHAFRNKKRIIVLNLFTSLLIQGISPIVYYIVALSFGIKTNIIYFFIFLPIVSSVTMLPISLGGLGVRDLLIIFLLGKIGISKDLAFALSLVNFVFLVIYSSAGGLIYVLGVHNRRLQRN
ncbi:MAG: lysylphosphatidylglycerol synthase transmembrane domain-containing protein [Candidatus Omnitrophota bacterium]|nr:flippase-like domain-containing protein [Candidatus Omnitrophota bacterium]